MYRAFRYYSIILSFHHPTNSSFHHLGIPSTLLTSKGVLTLLVADANSGSARHTIDENFIGMMCRVVQIKKNYDFVERHQ
jgi:hypothetical protein